MKKSGLADSPFFVTPGKESISPQAQPGSSPGKREVLKEAGPERTSSDTNQPRNQETTASSNRDTTTPWVQDAMIELVRKAVKDLGKEAATHRFTAEEKKAILDVIYSYKNLGIRTSENEITRIAINFVFEDYKQNGRNSVLERVLKALNE